MPRIRTHDTHGRWNGLSSSSPEAAVLQSQSQRAFEEDCAVAKEFAQSVRAAKCLSFIPAGIAITRSSRCDHRTTVFVARDEQA
jgi:hypothetical protein